MPNFTLMQFETTEPGALGSFKDSHPKTGRRRTRSIAIWDQFLIKKIDQICNHTCGLIEVEWADEWTSPAVGYHEFSLHLIM